MTKVRFRISISLDGYVAGPSQSLEHPLGVGGDRLHRWAFETETFRQMIGAEGGSTDESDRIAKEELVNVGATIMGRNMFGGYPGAWRMDEPWKGWWGENPPYHHPVFVLTHHARDPLFMEGGTEFHFVTDGIEAALERAKQAAGRQDVVVAGGAAAARQYLNAGLVDEMQLHLVPTLLGAGERLFEGTGNDLNGLALTRTVGAANVTHLLYTR